MEPLIGKKVRVTWKNPEDDWHFFELLGYAAPFLHLKGIDDPFEGSRHDGDDFLVNSSEVVTIAELRLEE